MTVFNSNQTNHLKQPMFFGEPVDIARYDTVKYPQLMKLTKRMRSFFWQPEEVDLSKDKNDFKLLTEHEKHIFTSNLKRQIVLDSVQGRAPVLSFLPVVSIPELEPLLAWWTAFETLHSESYSHIIQNIYPDPSKVFDEIKNIPEIMDCGTSIAKYYDQLNEAVQVMGRAPNLYGHKKRALWLALISVNALEGIRFYVSFACSWAFAELSKMEGNAKIIKLIARDENCVTEDAEVLTQRGWVQFPELKEQDCVAQYNKNGSIDFVIPHKIIKKEYSGKIIEFSNEKQTLYHTVTPDHRIIWEMNGEVREDTANSFNPSCAKHFKVAGQLLSKNNNQLSFKERLMIAIQADGTLDDGARNGSFTGCVPVYIYLKKETKIERLEWILKNLGYEYSRNKVNTDKGGFKYYIKVPINEFKPTKLFKDWLPNLNEISADWVNEFINEVIQWDGHMYKDDLSDIYYSSIIKSNVDIVQSLACLAGYKAHLSVQVDDRKETYSNVYRLRMIKRDFISCGPKPKTKKEIDYTGNVYCVSVPSGMFLVRQRNNIIVTGNCHLAATTQLLKLLPQDDPDFKQIAEETENQSVEVFKEAIEAEKKWASYLFKDGSMIGLNEKLLVDYVEWIGHKRMKAIGLPSPYSPGRTNPLPWTDKWISGGSVQVAPQEVEVSSYTIGDINNDTDELKNKLKDFEL